MVTAHDARPTRSARPWWRPIVYSAVAAAISSLLVPVPAFADPPTAPQAPYAPAVPDAGSRPMALGTLTMPGKPTATPTTPITGVAASPILQKVEKGRAEVAALGDQLIRVGQDRDLTRDQLTIARQQYTQAENTLREAQSNAANAAAAVMRDAAAMPPGTFGSGLSGLDNLARIQRGEDTQRVAARHLETAQITAQLALDHQTLTEQRYQALVAEYDKLNATLVRKQAAQQQFELTHAAELSAAEATQTAEDSRLGAEILAGAEAGRGADPRALQALAFALAQRGDPYVWSEEGPDQYDCSGLTYAAYRSVGFPLVRVSRDQYWQTRNKVVDRYSLLPGDLMFFSSSNSWQDIHHMSMYAGDGMMVEAPRSGLKVRLVPVRWSRLFQATRVFGSVEGVTEGPILGAPDPDSGDGVTPPVITPPGGTPPGVTPPVITPPSSSKPPTTSPPTSKPPTSPPSSSPPSSSPPSSSPPSSSPPSSSPPSSPATTPPTTPPPASPSGGNSPSGGSSSGGSSSGGSSSGGSSSGGSSSGGSASTSGSSSSSTSAATSESTKESASSSASKSSATTSGSSSASASN